MIEGRQKIIDMIVESYNLDKHFETEHFLYWINKINTWN